MMNLPVRACFMLFVVFFLASTPAGAQLGPKDGAHLAATNIERVKTGQPAPDFSLQNQDGKNISLSDYRGKKNVVLVFYRGHW
jgi:cytochrome oxidase Cu insertion factor (SCO1/SenC/PrrC family)